MKKRIAILLALTMAIAMVGCGAKADDAAPAAEPAAEEAAEEEAEPAEEVAEAEEPAEEPAGKIGEGRTLVVGVWGAEQEELVREHVIKPFEEETGATVELILGGSGDRYSKLYAEVDNPSMDVMYLNMAQTEQSTRDDMILPVDPEIVTNYDKLYDIAKCGNGYGVALNAIGLMYGTESGLPVPTSWTDLVSDTYAGKVSPYSMPSSQMDAGLVMLAKALGDDKDVEAAIAALAAAKPFPLITDGIPERNQAFLDGDVALGVQMGGYVYAAQDEGIPVDFIYPSEGAALSMNCAVIPKNTKNADLAKIFINYHLAQECQEAYAQVLYYGPTNSDIVLSDELAEKVVYGDDVEKLVALDNAWISENEASWTELWNTQILE